MKKLIYIASLSHSGSTLLDMLLSVHQDICGLGETNMFIDPSRRDHYLQRVEKTTCSCGEVLTNCSFWKQYLRTLTQPDHAGASFSELYSQLFRQTVDSGWSTLSDSSKYLPPLKSIVHAAQNCELPFSGKEILVILLFKDVRAFVASMKKRHSLRGFRELRRYFTMWTNSYRQLCAFLSDNNIDHLYVSYESLCFNTDRVMETIIDTAGLPPFDGQITLPRSAGHIGLGNGMQSHPVKSRHIFYDDRWFHDDRINILHLLMRQTRLFNRELHEKRVKGREHGD